jgi:hypothetical protein
VKSTVLFPFSNVNEERKYRQRLEKYMTFYSFHSGYRYDE